MSAWPLISYGVVQYQRRCVQVNSSWNHCDKDLFAQLIAVSSTSFCYCQDRECRVALASQMMHALLRHLKNDGIYYHWRDANSMWKVSVGKENQKITLGPQNVNAPTQAWIGELAKVETMKIGCWWRILQSCHSFCKLPLAFAVLLSLPVPASIKLGKRIDWSSI